MAHKYKILHNSEQDLLSAQVTKYLAEGWELWGNPFAIIFPSSDVCMSCQAVVRFDPSGHEVIGKVETALSEGNGLRMAQEPAGYNVQVPETPAIPTESNEMVPHGRSK